MAEPNDRQYSRKFERKLKRMKPRFGEVWKLEAMSNRHVASGLERIETCKPTASL